MIEERDACLEALDRAAPYFDNGHVAGVRPSTWAGLRYCAAATTPEPYAGEAAAAMVQAWLDEGRRRWRAGFSANPFTPEPMPRTAGSAQGGGRMSPPVTDPDTPAAVTAGASVPQGRPVETARSRPKAGDV